MTDIIAAVATGLPGAIGILRLSGPGCDVLAGRLLRPLNGGDFASAAPRRMIYCRLTDPEGRDLDRVLAVRTPAPHSYTGEDCCEVHCHGSPAVLGETMRALCELGARPADAGEFTRRAFLNGRMDLTAAEAVVDLIDAPGPEAARNAASQLGGALLRRVDGIYGDLLALVSRFQAVVDYPDEDVGEMEKDEMCAVLERVGADLGALAATYRRGTYLKTGVPTAIVGAPNSGKSTLLNALLGYDRAIVTAIPGTTRDTVSENVTVGGVLLRLTDTAGIRESRDPVEQLGVDRSRTALAESELVLLVLDGSRPLTEEDRAILRESAGRRAIALLNKSDLGTDTEAERETRAAFETVLPISARAGAGLDALAAAVGNLLAAPEGEAVGEVLTSLRQAEAVRRAEECVRGALEALRLGVTPDAALSDAELAMAALGEVTGRQVSEDIVNEIFSRFCVGK